MELTLTRTLAVCASQVCSESGWDSADGVASRDGGGYEGVTLGLLLSECCGGGGLDGYNFLAVSIRFGTYSSTTASHSILITHPNMQLPQMFSPFPNQEEKWLKEQPAQQFEPRSNTPSALIATSIGRTSE